ncbi:MAG TPA: LysR family transcriptional regulator [Candidatus Dormibacteraeota bacterium]
MSAEAAFELRQLRTFVSVAQRRSFTKAAEDLHIAQQAVSQQIKALERSLGVALLTRSSRVVELTPAGAAFLRDARRLLAAADGAARRVRAAARGEVGTLRLAYTLTGAWETIPVVLADLEHRFPGLTVEAREVFGADIHDLLLDEQIDLGIAPMTSHPRTIRYTTIRREVLRVAMSASRSAEAGTEVELSSLRDEQFEIWPRKMAPGFYDAVVGACQAAGFEPRLDERAGGNTVWGYIARGLGVALVNGSRAEQLPSGIRLLGVSNATPTLTIQALWRRNDELPALDRVLNAISHIAARERWL